MIKKIRESNFEFLRIYSIFCILLGHIIIHSNLLNITTGITNIVLSFILCFIIIHVNLFMLITGYFQYDKQFKIKKLIVLILEIFFYNFVLTILFDFTKIVNLSSFELLLKSSFFNMTSYWFIVNYIILYCLSPFINKLIKAISKKEHLYLISILSLIFFVFPYLFLGRFNVNNGYNLEQFIIMYFIGSYINKYKFELPNYNNKKKIYLISFIVCIVINFILYFVSSRFNNALFFQIKNHIFDYSNPIVVIQSISLFMLVGTFKFKSRLINTISASTLGIYLIHENEFTRNNLYTWIGFKNKNIEQNFSLFIKLFAWTIILFIIFFIIDYLRIIIIENNSYYQKMINCFSEMFNKKGVKHEKN